MTVSVMRTGARPINLLALAAAVLFSIFAISLVIADPSPQDVSEVPFIGP